MKLNEYREKNNLTFKELAIALDVPLTTVHRVCLEKSGIVCNLRTSAKIVSGTNGLVTYEDLLYASRSTTVQGAEK